MERYSFECDLSLLNKNDFLLYWYTAKRKQPFRSSVVLAKLGMLLQQLPMQKIDFKKYVKLFNLELILTNMNGTKHFILICVLYFQKKEELISASIFLCSNFINLLASFYVIISLAFSMMYAPHVQRHFLGKHWTHLKS